MVKILDRYIFIRSLKYFLLTYITFVSLFVIVEFVTHFDKFMHAQNPELGIIYIVGRIPMYSVRISPIAMLISSLISTGDFSSTSELTAAKSLGVSFYRFCSPIIVLSVFVSLASIAANELLVPKSTLLSRKMYAKIENKPLSFSISEGIWFKKDSRTFINMESINTDSGYAENVSVIILSNSTYPIEWIDAKKAIYSNGTIWILENANIRDLSKNKIEHTNKLYINLGTTLKDLMFYKTDPETESFFKLLRSIKHLKKLGYNTKKYEVDLYNKLAIPFIPILAAMFGIPLGTYNPRSKRSYTILIAALCIVSLWFTISIFSTMGKNGILPPVYASFSPEILFTSIAVIFFSRINT